MLLKYLKFFPNKRIYFFQAEDGIRSRVRSRGLGDVYKRRRPRSILEWSTKEETTHAYDEDFDDAVTQPKPTKVTRKPSPTKRVARLQFAGQATADKAISAARDTGCPL